MARTNIRGNAPVIPPTAHQQTPAEVAGEGATPIGAAYAKHRAAQSRWKGAARQSAERAATQPGATLADIRQSAQNHIEEHQYALRPQFFTMHAIKTIDGQDHVEIGGQLHPLHGSIIHTAEGPVAGERDVHRGRAVLHIAKAEPPAPTPARDPLLAHPSTFGRTPAQWRNPPELRADDPDIPQEAFGTPVREKSLEEDEAGIEDEPDEVEENAEPVIAGSRKSVPGYADALAARKRASGISPPVRGRAGGVRQRLTAGVPAAGGSAAMQHAALFGAGGGTEVETTTVRGRQFTSRESARPTTVHPEGDEYDPEKVGEAVALVHTDTRLQDHIAIKSAVPADMEISASPGVHIPDDRANNVALTHIARQTWGENDRAGLLFLARAHAFAQHRGIPAGQLNQEHIDSIVDSVSDDGHPVLDSVQAKVAEDRRAVVRAHARGEEKAALLPTFLPPGAPTTKAAMAKASPEDLAKLEEGYQAAREFIKPESTEESELAHTTETPEEPTTTRPRSPQNPFVVSSDQFHMAQSDAPAGYPAGSTAFGQTGGRTMGIVSGRAEIMGRAALTERSSDEAPPRLTSAAQAGMVEAGVRSLKNERTRNQSWAMQAAEDPRAALAGFTLTNLAEIADEGGFPNKPILEEDGTLITYPKGHRLEGEPKRDADGNLQYTKRARPVRSGRNNPRVASGISAAGAGFMRHTAETFLSANVMQDVENRALDVAQTSDVLQQAQTAPDARTIAQGHLDIAEARRGALEEGRTQQGIPDAAAVPESTRLTARQMRARSKAAQARIIAEREHHEATKGAAHEQAYNAYMDAITTHGVGSPEHFAAEDALNLAGRAYRGSAWVPLTDAAQAREKAAAQIKADKQKARAKAGFTRIDLDADKKAKRRVASSRGVTLGPDEAAARAQAGIATEQGAVTAKTMADATKRANARKRRASRKAGSGEQESA